MTIYIIILIVCLHVFLGICMFESGFKKLTEKYPSMAYISDHDYILVRTIFSFTWFPLLICMLLNKLFTGKNLV